MCSRLWVPSRNQSGVASGVIIRFALIYHALGGISLFPPDAFICSITSFHGRGFLPVQANRTSPCKDERDVDRAFVSAPLAKLARGSSQRWLRPQNPCSLDELVRDIDRVCAAEQPLQRGRRCRVKEHKYPHRLGQHISPFRGPMLYSCPETKQCEGRSWNTRLYREKRQDSSVVLSTAAWTSSASASYSASMQNGLKRKALKLNRPMRLRQQTSQPFNRPFLFPIIGKFCHKKTRWSLLPPKTGPSYSTISRAP
jgi:hypothetical protein